MTQTTGWEKIAQAQDSSVTGNTTGTTSERLKVPGGWLVRTVVVHYRGAAVDQAFVSDPGHEWTL